MLEIVIHEITPVSANDMYFVPRKLGKMIKTPHYRSFESSMKERLEELVTPESISEFMDKLDDPSFAINFTIDLFMPDDEFYRRDSSNYLKTVEDIVKNHIGIDDSRNKKVSAEKFISETGKWKFVCKITAVQYEDLNEAKWHKPARR